MFSNSRILATICPGVCAMKYCSSSTGTISVSTSHMLRFGGEALSRAEPPAGPLKFKMLQFSCKQPEISPTIGPNRKVGKTSNERTKLEREHHDPRPCPRSFSARKIFPDLSLSGSQANTIISILDASQRNRCTGSRDIFIFLKIPIGPS